MIETQYITLDMKPSGVLPVLYCSQYDIGRPLGMVVNNGGEAVDLGDYTVTIEATRTDGVAITAAVTTDGNIGAFETTATMTNKADRYGAQLVLSAFGKRVASLPFVMCVVRAEMDENAESIEEDASLYQQYTETVQTLIANIRADVTQNSSDIAANSNAIAANTNAIAAEIAARQAADDIINGLNVVWIGDSYVQANSLGADQNKRFSTLVSNALGMTEHNYAIGGSGFLAPSGSTYGEQLTSAIAGMTDEQKRTTKYVFVCGGRNDPYLVPDWTLSQLATAVRDVYTRAHTAYPNAMIVGVPMTWSAEALSQTYQRYLSELTNCMENITVPCITITTAWTWLIGRIGSILSDNVHPNVEGHRDMAIMIYQSLKGTNMYRNNQRYSHTSNGMTTVIKLINNKISVMVSGTPSSALSFGNYIFQNFNLGAYAGLRTDNMFFVTLVGRDGTTACCQIGFYASSGKIVCSLQLVTNSMTQQEYHGFVEFENGMVL